MAKGLGLEAFSGVLVAAVVPDGPAAQAGLVAGDLVTEVNRKKVPDIGAFRAALALTEAGQPALLRLQRGEVTRYLAVKPGGERRRFSAKEKLRILRLAEESCFRIGKPDGAGLDGTARHKAV